MRALSSYDDSEPRASARAVRAGRGGTYLLTTTTYGSWLPGHAKGFVSRAPDGRGGWVMHNKIETPFDENMPALTARAKARMKGEKVVFDVRHALAANVACAEVAERHGLLLFAGSVMATHVHLVVRSLEAEGEAVLQLFKGTIARRLGQEFGKPRAPSWWTRKGSHRLLTSENSVRRAVVYVIDEQEDPLVTFGMCVQDVPEWWSVGGA